MQQQLQLAVTSAPAAAADAAPAGSDIETATANQGLLTDTNRLKTITCLLPVLADASMASTRLGVHDPWHSYGCEVLQLLEQYIRTVLAHLPCGLETAAGAHSQEHMQWQQQLQLGVGAEPIGPQHFRLACMQAFTCVLAVSASLHMWAAQGTCSW